MSEEIERLYKKLDSILSFTYLFRSDLKNLKPVNLNCAFGKVESNFD